MNNMTNGDVVVFSCACGQNFGWKDQYDDGSFYCECCGSISFINSQWLPRKTFNTPNEVQEVSDIVKENISMQYLISTICDEIKEMLLKKNEAYGNSASEPVRVFSKVDALEQINVRIDDKLSRIAKGTEYQGDDTELDLIGYLILKRCVKRKQ